MNLLIQLISCTYPHCISSEPFPAAALDYGGSAMWKGKFYVYAVDVRLDLTMQNVRLDLAIAAKGGSFIHCHSECKCN